jgi:hypothetical protein
LAAASECSSSSSSASTVHRGFATRSYHSCCSGSTLHYWCAVSRGRSCTACVSCNF